MMKFLKFTAGSDTRYVSTNTIALWELIGATEVKGWCTMGGAKYVKLVTTGATTAMVNELNAQTKLAQQKSWTNVSFPIELPAGTALTSVEQA